MFADLLFDALAPQTAERHRALVRLEDINPRSRSRRSTRSGRLSALPRVSRSASASAPTTETRRVARTPPYELHLRDAPEVVEALRYLERKGGVLVGHGYTHQWDGASNPYNGVTGDDVEFYRVTEDARRRREAQSARFPSDRTTAWSEHRIVAANREFRGRGSRRTADLRVPALLRLGTRLPCGRTPLRRPLGAKHVLLASALDGGPSRLPQERSQFFPYAVRDVYGSKVLPENLGSSQPKRMALLPGATPAISSARHGRTSSYATASPPSTSIPSSTSTPEATRRDPGPRLHLRRSPLS